MREAAQAFDFAHEEEVVVSASLVQLMNADIADYERRNAEPPRGSPAARLAGRKALKKLEPSGGFDDGIRGPMNSQQRAIHAAQPHPLEDMANLRPRLSGVDDTTKGLAMLVELCAFQPWAKLAKPKALEDDPRKSRLAEIAFLLGGDTTREDVIEIDNVLYPKRHRSRWKLALLVLGGVGIGIATGGLAAPAVGGAIGGAMGFGGAVAVNAGLAALGGGALAAGGLGMAGGTALIGGLGGLVGAGAGAQPRSWSSTMTSRRMPCALRRLSSKR